MKNKIIIIITSCIIVVTLCIVAIASDTFNIFKVGEYYNEVRNDTKKEVVATYNENQVTLAELKYQKNINKMGENTLKELENAGASEEVIEDVLKSINETDIDIVNRILIGFILLEEAEVKGVSATKEEVNEFISSAKKTYEEFPESKAQIDSFCEGAGITVEEYWNDIESQSFATLSRQKLKNHFIAEYCRDNGFSVDNHSLEERRKIDEAYDNYSYELLAAHKDEIVYYIDH